MENLSKLEWEILDRLSDEHECITTMGFPKRSWLKVRKAVYELYKRGLILTEDKTVEYNKLLDEPKKHIDAHYWFGLTESGVKYWEDWSKTYSDGPVDWSKSWASHLSYDKHDGYIEGASPEVCSAALKGLPEDKEWKIDMNTISHSEIDGFKAKYYKYLPGGHRIMFKLREKANL